MFEKILYLSEKILTLQLNKKGRILVLSNNTTFSTIAYLSIINSNNTCIILSEETPIKKINNIINIYEVNLVLMSSEYANKYVENLRAKVILYDKFELKEYKKININDIKIESNFNSEEDDALLLFTSGSTGSPKGVRLSNKNLTESASAIVEFLDLSDRDIICKMVPDYHIYGISAINSHLLSGSTIVFSRYGVNLNKVIDDITKYGCTGFTGIPTLLSLLIEKKNFNKNSLPTMRYLIQSSGELKIDKQKKLVNSFSGCDIFVVYGQTESCGPITFINLKEEIEKIGSVGRGLKNIKCKIVNENGDECECGQIGELVVSGSSIMKGYYTNKESVNVSELYTGDLAYFDKDGYIYLTGRKNNIVKISGYRVNLKEIEEELLKIKSIEDVAVITKEAHIIGQQIIAYIKSDNNIDEYELQK